MSTALPSKKIEAFFFRYGSSQALFRWLGFRLFVAQKQLKLTAIESASDTQLSATNYLEGWEKQARLITPSRGLLQLVTGLAGLTGAAAMATVLNATGNHAINIWVPLALFAFIPLLMTVLSFYFTVVSRAGLESGAHPLLAFWVKKLNLSALLPYKNMLFPWVAWQSQRIAWVFTIGALVSFFALATFQDYQFGWSSTLIRHDTTMTSLMSIVSMPWQAFVPAPSADLVMQTRFSMQSGAEQAVVEEQWWLTMVLAIVCYGIMPRIMLSACLRYRFVRHLRWSIANSGDVQQFVVAQTHQPSRDPIQSDATYAAPEPLTVDPEQADLISWQQPASRFSVVRNLGSGDWQEDEQWLNSAQARRQRPVCLLIDPKQTPTGELADCLELLQHQNNSVVLVLTPLDQPDDRYQAQLKSWQFFASRQNIPLKQGS